jgi:acetoin utilization protein AcuB
MEMPHVRDWMTRDPVIVASGSSLGTVRALMQRADVHRLLVVDDDGRLVGIVAWGDLAEVWPSRFNPLEPYETRELMARVRVDEVMVHPVVTIDPDATMSEAASLMFEHRIGALPVVEADRVVGILTSSDILQGLVRVLSQHVA